MISSESKTSGFSLHGKEYTHKNIFAKNTQIKNSTFGPQLAKTLHAACTFMEYYGIINFQKRAGSNSIMLLEINNMIF